MRETLLVDYGEARRELGGLSESSVRRAVARGELRPVRVGRRVFFRRSSIVAFVRRNERLRGRRSPAR